MQLSKVHLAWDLQSTPYGRTNASELHLQLEDPSLGPDTAHRWHMPILPPENRAPDSGARGMPQEPKSGEEAFGSLTVSNPGASQRTAASRWAAFADGVSLLIGKARNNAEDLGSAGRPTQISRVNDRRPHRRFAFSPAEEPVRLVKSKVPRGSPDRIRTGATALRGRRPRPLDDGAELGGPEASWVPILLWNWCWH